MTEAETERAAVVAWLRNTSAVLLADGCFETTISAQELSEAADAIERREHLSNEAEGG